MNIGPDTFEKAIASSCIQLAQAYSITDRIPIEEAKAKVGKYLQSLKQYQTEEDDYDPTSHFRAAVSLAIKAADGKADKAYLELLKLRETLN
jgi:hypothetical protein